MKRESQKNILRIMSEIRDAVRSFGKRVSTLAEELDQAYEKELAPDGSMSQETAEQFKGDFCPTHEALRLMREAYSNVQDAEKAISGGASER